MNPFCWIDIIFFGLVSLSDEVAYLHPVNHYAVLRYDATQLEAPVKNADLSHTLARL
jgi:hypothetical protein